MPTATLLPEFDGVLPSLSLPSFSATSLNGFTSSGSLSQWHLSAGRGNDGGHSPGDSFYFGAGETVNGGGEYASNADGTLISPLIDLRGINGTGVLRFNYFLQVEDGDLASVSILHNGIETLLADSRPGGGLLSSTAGFTHVTLNLSAVAGQQIQILFRLTSNSSGVREGWYIDDVELVITHLVYGVVIAQSFDLARFFDIRFPPGILPNSLLSGGGLESGADRLSVLSLTRLDSGGLRILAVVVPGQVPGPGLTPVNSLTTGLTNVPDSVNSQRRANELLFGVRAGAGDEGPNAEPLAELRGAPPRRPADNAVMLLVVGVDQAEQRLWELFRLPGDPERAPAPRQRLDHPWLQGTLQGLGVTNPLEFSAWLATVITQILQRRALPLITSRLTLPLDGNVGDSKDLTVVFFESPQPAVLEEREADFQVPAALVAALFAACACRESGPPPELKRSVRKL